MTDVLERLQTVAEPEGTGAPRERRGEPAAALGEGPRWALAALLAGAGVIHFAMAPSHLAESTIEGAGFLAAGWLQLALAVGLLSRPRRGLLVLAGTSSAVLIGIWLWSRVFGLPFGPHAGHPESVSIVDGAAVAFEAAVVLLVVAALAGSVRPWMRRGGVPALLVPVAVVVVTTAALASPDARDHAASSHGDHVAAAHDHDEDDLGFSLLSNGHEHGDAEWVELDPATQAELDAQLALTAELVERYPTITDAEAAGYRRAGPFAPGLGTHYTGGAGFGLNSDGLMSPEDIMRPVLIYDGVEPDSPLAGFMYLVLSEDEPEGFAGPNDHWHYHTNVCIVFNDGEIDTPFGADLPGVTEEMCQEVGGSFIEFTGWMVHVWTVPGYESELGVFSELNPKLTCPDGTYYMIPIEELGDGNTMCRDA